MGEEKRGKFGEGNSALIVGRDRRPFDRIAFPYSAVVLLLGP